MKTSLAQAEIKKVTPEANAFKLKINQNPCLSLEPLENIWESYHLQSCTLNLRQWKQS